MKVQGHVSASRKVDFNVVELHQHGEELSLHDYRDFSMTHFLRWEEAGVFRLLTVW